MCDPRRFDAFGYDPTYHFPSYKSWCGFLWTLVIGLTMFFYMAKSTHRFLYDPPRMFTASLPMDDEPVPMLDSWKLFFYLGGDTFYDERYFTFKYKLFKKGAEDGQKYIDLGLRNCSYVSEYTEKYHADAKCPEDWGYLYGAEELPDQVMINVEMRRCTGKPYCKSPEEIDKVVMDGVLVLHFKEELLRWQHRSIRKLETPQVKVKKTRRDRAFTWIFSKGRTVHSNLYFAKKQITIHSRVMPYIFQDHFMDKYSSLHFSYRQDYVLDYDSLYADIIFLLAEDLVVEEQVHETILDLLGQWGGAWGFLFGICGLVAMCHNQRQCEKHYRANGVGDIRDHKKEDFNHIGRVATGPVLPRKRSSVADAPPPYSTGENDPLLSGKAE